MGVKGLWNFLSPICDKKSVWEIQGQTVAIDLSCWICDSQTISFSVARPHLRNLFFRTSCLLLSGIQPIFVLEGDAPDLKQKEIRRRIQTAYKRVEGPVKGKQTRSRLNNMIKQCCILFDALGVCSIQSPGEGEAMCAHLNAMGLVDGCITQDNDCFLYGANVVYRNFSSGHSSKGGNPTGFSVDAFDMVRIKKLLGLDREGLVALALLCGCDYETDSNDTRGVAGIGIETAAQLIVNLTKYSEGTISRLKSWRNSSNFLKLEKEAALVDKGPNCAHCGHRGNLGRHDRVGCKICGSDQGCKVNCSYSKDNSLLSMSHDKRKALMLELGIRHKALVNPNFPSQSIIDEYLTPLSSTKSQFSPSISSWNQPNIQKCLEFAATYLEWSEEYALEKFLPLLARWNVLHKKTSKETHKYDITPVIIKKERVSKGTRYFEVEWGIIPAISQTSHFTTQEPCCKFEEAYPHLVEEYQMKKKKTTNKGGVKHQKKKTEKKGKCGCSVGSLSKKGHLCQFFSNKEVEKFNVARKKETTSPESGVEDVTALLENLSVKNDIFPLLPEYNPDSDDEIDPSELSAIVKRIVGINPTHPLADVKLTENCNTLAGTLDYKHKDKSAYSSTNDYQIHKTVSVCEEDDGSITTSLEYLPDSDDEIDPSELSEIVKRIVGIHSTNSNAEVKVHEKRISQGQTMEYKLKDKPESFSDQDSEINDFVTGFEEFDLSLEYRVKSYVKEQADTSYSPSITSSDKGTPYKHISKGCSENNEQAKSSVDNNSIAISTPQNLKGHFPYPNFSLGITPLLQSSDIYKANKSTHSLLEKDNFE